MLPYPLSNIPRPSLLLYLSIQDFTILVSFFFNYLDKFYIDISLVYGGLPGHIPGHPWSGQLGPVMVSPHTTPPNTQLLMTSPVQPPPPNPIPQTHPPMVTQV